MIHGPMDQDLVQTADPALTVGESQHTLSGNKYDGPARRGQNYEIKVAFHVNFLFTI